MCVARFDHSCINEEAECSTMVNNPLRTSSKHVQKWQHMLTACPSLTGVIKNAGKPISDSSALMLQYWTPTTAQSTGSAQCTQGTFVKGIIILACDAMVLEVHITTNHNTGIEFFSILALLVCVYMHFQLHRITSQAKNIVNRCGWLSYYLCLDVHAPKANGSQFVYLCICMSDL